MLWGVVATSVAAISSLTFATLAWGVAITTLVSLCALLLVLQNDSQQARRMLTIAITAVVAQLMYHNPSWNMGWIQFIIIAVFAVLFIVSSNEWRLRPHFFGVISAVVLFVIGLPVTLLLAVWYYPSGEWWMALVALHILSWLTLSINEVIMIDEEKIAESYALGMAIAVFFALGYKAAYPLSDLMNVTFTETLIVLYAILILVIATVYICYQTYQNHKHKKEQEKSIAEKERDEEARKRRIEEKNMLLENPESWKKFLSFLMRRDMSQTEKLTVIGKLDLSELVTVSHHKRHIYTDQKMKEAIRCLSDIYEREELDENIAILFAQYDQVKDILGQDKIKTYVGYEYVNNLIRNADPRFAK